MFGIDLFLLAYFASGPACVVLGLLLAIFPPLPSKRRLLVAGWLAGAGALGILFMWLWWENICWETWSPCEGTAYEAFGFAGFATIFVWIAGLVFGVDAYQQERRERRGH